MTDNHIVNVYERAKAAVSANRVASGERDSDSSDQVLVSFNKWHSDKFGWIDHRHGDCAARWEGWKASSDQLIAENMALLAEKEKSFANGRFRGLDEAQNLCYQMALGEYRPEGSRYTLFTPKKERMLGDVLVKACNAIADLPDGPYERQRIKREHKAAMSKEPSNG